MVKDYKELIKRNYWIIILIFAFIPSRIIYDYYMSNIIHNRSVNFDTIKINGIIQNINYSKGGTILKFQYFNERIYFPDICVTKKQIPRDKRLHDIAEKGDSIYKAAYSDTLFLYKQNGKNYFFVFDRDDLY